MITWPLMKNAITWRDKFSLIRFLISSDKLTNGPEVKEFERQWSYWIGSKYALMVSSGSTANFLMLAAIKEKYGFKTGDKVIVPACTWVTNISPVIQLGFEPIFCDINLTNYSFDVDHLKQIREQHSDIKIVFVTHLLGFSADNEKYKEIFPEALIVDDVCESHGCLSPDGTRRGANSLAASFSFYFGHHMTTIEGGMVCTNNTELYELMRLKRSHGMAREASPLLFQQYANQNPDVDKMFLFMTDGYNFRNHEVCAVLGLSQLKRLDRNIQIRRDNYKFFHKNLLENRKYYAPEYQPGNSSFSLPLISIDRSRIDKTKVLFDKHGIEYRPIISGNLLRHPAFKKYKLCTSKENPNVEILHNNGLYVGNSQYVNHDKIDKLFNILSIV